MTAKSDKQKFKNSSFASRARSDSAADSDKQPAQEDPSSRGHRIPSYHELNNRADIEQVDNKIQQEPLGEKKDRKIPTYHELTNRAEDIYSVQQQKQTSQQIAQPSQQPLDAQRVAQPQEQQVQNQEKVQPQGQTPAVKQGQHHTVSSDETGRLEVIDWSEKSQVISQQQTLFEQNQEIPENTQPEPNQEAPEIVQPEPVQETSEHVQPSVEIKEAEQKNDGTGVAESKTPKLENSTPQPVASEQVISTPEPVEQTVAQAPVPEKPVAQEPIAEKPVHVEKEQKDVPVQKKLETQARFQEKSPKKATEQLISTASGAASLKASSSVSNKKTLSSTPQFKKEDQKEKYKVIASFPEGTIRAKKPSSK